MNHLPSNIRRNLLKLIPLSVFNEITCFTFYDDHPRDNKDVDVIVCTKRGEIQEYYKRELGEKYLLDMNNISQIKIVRNTKCQLFYLVVADDNLYILSRKEKIKVLHEIRNIANFVLEDSDCEGRANLKIILKDDAVPLIFDENFERKALISCETQKSDTLPLLLELQRKLTEAKYCVNFNESKYKELQDLRQESAFYMYQKSSPQSSTLSNKLNNKEISNLLQIETRNPEVRLCNKNILIILNVLNKNVVSFENICVLLHNTLKNSITYTTKVFKETLKGTYWEETNKVNANSKGTIVAVINLAELQNYPHSRVEFDVVLSYKKGEKSLLLPYEKIVITANDIMGENFDILSNKDNDNNKIILCILSSCNKINLHLTQIDTENNTATPFEICKCLNMEFVPNVNNVAIHNTSPYHILHGVMVVFDNAFDCNMKIQLYTRTPSQVLSFIHYVYDAVPYRIIITTPDTNISSIKDNQSINIENHTRELNLANLGKSIVTQTSIIKQYFDNCLIKMNENKNPMIREKVGREIDMMAHGASNFLEFRQKMLDVTPNGIVGLAQCDEDTESCEMVID